jgi:hypothetical protein
MEGRPGLRQKQSHKLREPFHRFEPNRCESLHHTAVKRSQENLEALPFRCRGDKSRNYEGVRRRWCRVTRRR